MSDYRDQVEALSARVDDLERELAELRGGESGELRCPHCKLPMTTGTFVEKDRYGVHSVVKEQKFLLLDEKTERSIDRAVGHGHDGFCEDCSTVVVKGRFAD